MNLLTIRNKTIYVSAVTLRGLRAVAEMTGKSCADEVADEWLAERLNTDADASAVAKIYAKHLTAARKEADALALAKHLTAARKEADALALANEDALP
jgi:rhamnogalacturonyl hydrolase YesR